MSIDTLARAVMRIELFHGLKPLQITEIVRQAERIVFKPGETIVAAGQEGAAAFLIVAGVAVRTDSPLDRRIAEPVPVGALIGEMAMLVETEYSSTIIAKQAVRALRITRQALHAQMAEDFRLAEHLLGKIAGRLHVLAEELRAVDATMAGVQDYRGQTAHKAAGVVQRGGPANVVVRH